MNHTPQFNGHCAACTGNDRGIVILCPFHAAAPELVAALTKLIAHHDARSGVTGDQHREAWAEARTALARAKGES